tara:strand:- start:2523 stop:2690 length:168 start_codon:yes stop_codon:yes gene_type:complete
VNKPMIYERNPDTDTVYVRHHGAPISERVELSEYIQQDLPLEPTPIELNEDVESN